MTGNKQNKEKKTSKRVKPKANEPRILKTGEDVFLISSLGHKVKLLPVSPYLLENVRKAADDDWIDGYIDDDENEIEGHDDLPTIPSYTTEVSGKEFEIEHDLTTLDDTEDEDEKKANWDKWDAYQADLVAYETLQTTRAARVILHSGIEVEYPPENDDWAKFQLEILRADVPKEEPQRKQHYIETVILGSQADVMMVVTEVMSLIGVNREEVDRIKAEMFQGNVSRETSDNVKPEKEKSVESK